LKILIPFDFASRAIMAAVLIYGATGYTGRLACEYAQKTGLEFAIGARSETKVRELASSLNVSDYYTFAVTDPNAIDTALQGKRVLLNCAGPFFRTAKPLIEACLRNGVHYLDVAAELDSYRLAEELDGRAKEAGAMLMPGCGGSVAMLGCLTDYVLKDITDASSINISLHISGSMSKGSAVSASENVTTGTLQRSGGQLIAQDIANTKDFDFEDGRGAVSSFPVTLPDLITLWKSTGVEIIRTYINVSGDAFPTGNLDALPAGPSREEREANPYHVAVQAIGSNGTRSAVLHTVNGYTFTSQASIEAVMLVLAGHARTGFQTPAGIFGYEFAQRIHGSVFKAV
jgi:short subunit dehydrogenase-like uncharacterized protein